MAFNFLTSRNDAIRFISSLDDNVQTTTKKQKAAYRKYLETLDESLLTLTGTPLVFLMRPLTWATQEIASRDAKGLCVPGVYTDAPTARELLRLSVESFENWPKEWGDMESKFRFEYGHRVLSREWVGDLFPGLCAEAAGVLLDTLPLPATKEGDQTGPFPEKETQD